MSLKQKLFMMRIVVLGSAAAMPSPFRNPSSIGIRFGGNVYLMDCGEGTQRQLMRFGLSYSKVKSIFISHLHADHILGIPGLVYTLSLSGRKDELVIFGPKGTAVAVENLLLGEGRSFVRVQEVSDGFEFKGENFSVKAFQVSHYKTALGWSFEESERLNFDEEKAHELGVKGRLFGELEKNKSVKIGSKTVKLEDVSKTRPGRKVVYTGDTVPCDSISKAASGADILFHDSTFSKELEKEAKEKQHSTAEQAALAAKKAKAKLLVLTHISNRYDDPAVLVGEAKKIFDKTHVAFDGMELLLE